RTGRARSGDRRRGALRADPDRRQDRWADDGLCGHGGAFAARAHRRGPGGRSAYARNAPTQRGQLAGTLAKIRALKKEYLLAHPGVLRKSTTKLHTWPLDRDQPNAKNPDEAVGSDPLV